MINMLWESMTPAEIVTVVGWISAKTHDVVKIMAEESAAVLGVKNENQPTIDIIQLVIVAWRLTTVSTGITGSKLMQNVKESVEMSVSRFFE